MTRSGVWVLLDSKKWVVWRGRNGEDEMKSVKTITVLRCVAGRKRGKLMKIRKWEILRVVDGETKVVCTNFI